MKFLSILAAASLALAPAIASAGSHVTTDDRDPKAGGLAGRALDDSVVPAGAIVLGVLVVAGGAIIAILGGGSSDSNNNTND
jgi:hypothetical protein